MRRKDAAFAWKTLEACLCIRVCDIHKGFLVGKPVCEWEGFEGSVDFFFLIFFVADMLSRKTSSCLIPTFDPLSEYLQWNLDYQNVVIRIDKKIVSINNAIYLLFQFLIVL